ncbi:MAG TPA: hypothetical protein VKZ53_23745 [Candidatus Angelobacter sp.]|nr:hypothetical protein [Candidatus Angelobacter sp.]
MNTGVNTGNPETSTSSKPNGAAVESATTAQEPGKRRRRSGSTAGASEGHGRFFLVRKDAGPGNTPALGQELPSEGDAIVEAFRTGATYLRVEEFKPVADFSGGTPALKKEPVTRK